MLEATRELLAEGAYPTVEQVADRAGVSRSTAYRYFPNRQSLLVATYPQLDPAATLASDELDDPVARFTAIVDEFVASVQRWEPELRASLRLSLDPATSPETLPLRQGRAIRWLTDALEPLRAELGDAALRRLVLSVRATTGIESYVWLCDIARVAPDEAAEIMRSSARTLLDAALARRG